MSENIKIHTPYNPAPKVNLTSASERMEARKLRLNKKSVFIGSHQEWRKIKTKVGPKRIKYIVVTCEQYASENELNTGDK